jgi:superfamily I DNA/RNA helicase
MSYPRVLQRTPAPADLVEQASKAVREELRAQSREIELLAFAVTACPGPSADFEIHRLDVGPVEFDWTWEGAEALRPYPEGDPDAADGPVDVGRTWQGEVVEVDEVQGHVYVAVARESPAPITGPFLVRPFEFLAGLAEVFGGALAASAAAELASALAAAEGASGAVASPGAPCAAAGPAWNHAWMRLWGPPGTGKTWTIGRIVAEALATSDERFLIVSTTNRATDGVAIEIGRALRAKDPAIELRDLVVRIGKNANAAEMDAAGFGDLLYDGASDVRLALAQRQRTLQTARDPGERARLRQEIKNLRQLVQDGAAGFFMDHGRAIVTTVFGALSRLRTSKCAETLADGRAPFTTVIVDEAGLVSRAHTAALSMLAARRMVVVGDPKQLSPITRISRILPAAQSRWLARSALHHLEPETRDASVRLLVRQHRMAPEIRALVSDYQYGGLLEDADGVAERSRRFALDTPLVGEPRTIWYVLDEDGGEAAHIRPERPEGGKSWVRRRTRHVIEKIFQSHERLARGTGLFLSPFAAQARAIQYLVHDLGAAGRWRASTLHQQQGAEADYVIFDTVNAGSTAWPHDEWQRLLNVGLSRARECVILLASRQEMREPYMVALARRLAPRVLVRQGSRWTWRTVAARIEHAGSAARRRARPELLGAQLESRRALRPLMSADQQSLCDLEMDGGPRLVRGVAGSGKTWVMASWLARTLQVRPRDEALVVYGNQALRRLLNSMLTEAWSASGESAGPVPWERIRLVHVGALLNERLSGIGIARDAADFGYDYDAMARCFLESPPGEDILPVCDALFVDEAQDLGPDALRLLTALIRARGDDDRERAAMIFYDNAQNIYGRPTPRWSEMGIDMRGRSRIMKESFRSTRPISEIALNVLHRLTDLRRDPDQRELLRRGLIEELRGGGTVWFRVRFNQIDGPWPELRLYPTRAAELAAVAARVRIWIADEGVRPKDICLIANRRETCQAIAEACAVELEGAGAKAHFASGGAVDVEDGAVLVTTPHSFKGYDAEIVVVLAVDEFWAQGRTLAHNLYVAMTRARSLLLVTGLGGAERAAPSAVTALVRGAFLDQRELGRKDPALTKSEVLSEIDARLGGEHREWLARLAEAHEIRTDPLLAADGAVAAQPLFWFARAGRPVVCFGHRAPDALELQALEEMGAFILEPGAA